jgi:type VI secretion system secreted protein Hcp
MRNGVLGTFALGLMVGAVLVAGQADAAGYIKLGDIKGEVATSERHKEWIEVVSFTSSVGGYEAGGRLAATRSQAGTGNRGTLTLTKAYDRASPKLMEACSKGQYMGTAELEVCGTDGQCVLYTLTDVVIERYTVTRTHEELALNYTKIDWRPAAGGATLAAPANPSRAR